MLPHPFTQTFKLPSEIAPCNLLAQRRRGPAQRSKSPGRGLGRSSSCLSMPRRMLVYLGFPGGGCPGELSGSLPSHSAILGEKHQCKVEGEAGTEGAWLWPQLQEGPSGYNRTWFGVRVPAGRS